MIAMLARIGHRRLAKSIRDQADAVNKLASIKGDRQECAYWLYGYRAALNDVLGMMRGRKENSLSGVPPAAP